MTLIGQLVVTPGRSVDVPRENRAARYGFKAAASVLGSRSPVAMPVPAAGGAVGGSAPGKRLQFDKKEDTSLPLLSLS